MHHVNGSSGAKNCKIVKCVWSRRSKNRSGNSRIYPDIARSADLFKRIYRCPIRHFDPVSRVFIPTKVGAVHYMRKVHTLLWFTKFKE